MSADGEIVRQAGGAPAEAGATPAPTPSRWVLILLGAALLCFTALNWRVGSYRGDELYYMVGGMNALQRGEWLIPEYFGDIRLQKPPLNYWLVALSYRVFGIGLWQARLPGALAGVLCIWLTCLLASCAFGDRRAGLYAACALLASYALARQPHWATTDVVLTALAVAAFYGFAETLLRDKRWGAILAWAAMGVASLEKGPVGVVVPLSAALLWRLLYRRTSAVRWRRLFPPAGLLLFAAIALPWPLAVVHRLGLGRALEYWGGVAGRHVDAEPRHVLAGIAYYVKAVLRGLLPWSLLLFFYRRRSRFTDRAVLLWLLGLVPLVAFGLWVTMLRIRYVMAAMAAFAALCGRAMARLEERPDEGRILWRVLGWALYAPMGLGLLGGLLLLPSAFLWVKTGAAVATAAAMAVISAGGCIGVWALRRRKLSPHWVVTAAVSIAAVQCLYWQVWFSAYYRAPAYDLSRAHLRHARVPAALVRLQRKERSLAVVGAGRDLPSLGTWAPGGWPAIDWQGVGRYPLILTSRRGWAFAPPVLKEAYEEVDSMLTVDGSVGFNPLWYLDRREGRPREILPGQRALIVLRRTESPPGP